MIGIPYSELELIGFIGLTLTSALLARRRISGIFLVFGLAAVIGYYLHVPYFGREMIALVVMMAVAAIGYALFLRYEGATA